MAHSPFKSIFLKETSNTSARRSPDKILNSFEIGFVKQFEALKVTNKFLENQNKQLLTEIEQLRYQKSYNESKFIQKINFEEEAMMQYQKQKNYQLELHHLKTEEEMHKYKRQNQKVIQFYTRQITHLQAQNQQIKQRNLYLDNTNHSLNHQLLKIQKELILSRDSLLQSNQRNIILQEAQKNLESIIKDLEYQKSEMERQIHVLLQIEAEKSHIIKEIESKLKQCQHRQNALNQRLTVLSSDFSKISQNSTNLKQTIQIKVKQIQQLEHILDRMNYELGQRQKLLILSNSNYANTKLQYEESVKREKLRQKQTLELMSQNERLYKELNIAKHKLSDISINYNISL